MSNNYMPMPRRWDYKQENVLGSGNFSTVFRVTHRMSGKQYAVKKSRKSAVSVADKNMWLAVGVLGQGARQLDARVLSMHARVLRTRMQRHKQWCVCLHGCVQVSPEFAAWTGARRALLELQQRFEGAWHQWRCCNTRPSTQIRVPSHVCALYGHRRAHTTHMDACAQTDVCGHTHTHTCTHARTHSLQEVQALAAVEGHPNIVTYYDSWTEPAEQNQGRAVRDIMYV